jgi:electron transport complex protein RnfG
MNQILRITIGLTISCLIAAMVMGAVFTITDTAKKHNEHLNVENTMLSLLGYGKTNPAPSDLKFYNIYRYIIEEGKEKYLGYMVPVRKGNEEIYELLTISLGGGFVAKHPVNISPEKAIEPPNRQNALRAVLRPPKKFLFADKTIIAMLGDKRLAYLLPGEVPGFKTFIKVMLAIDPTFKILGLDIMEQEEDPGLGGEIVRGYFRNQFKDKSFEKIKKLEVVKKPLPEEYRAYLERKKLGESALSKKEIERIRSKYEDKDIYALTGATISSVAVTTGVKNMMKRFAYRLKVLNGVITDQKVPVPF